MYFHIIPKQIHLNLFNIIYAISKYMINTVDIKNSKLKKNDIFYWTREIDQ